MARNEIHVHAPPGDVFSVLANPAAYAEWVVGTREVGDADPDWPSPGARFRYRVGVGPLGVGGHTVVEEAEPPVHLQLRAVLPPLGSARIRLDLQPERSGTRVTLVEDPGDLRSAFAFTPAMQLITRARNAHSLARLRALAERAQSG